MGLFTCENCGARTEYNYQGLCRNCEVERLDEEEKREIINTSMPNGVITTWNDSPSFLDKKHNYMYFRIPNNQRLFFSPEKSYQIIVKEAES